MGSLISANEIVALHDRWTAEWHDQPPTLAPRELGSFEGALRRLHAANFQLWHEEDKARVPGASDTEIAQVKRAIDRLNQSRNDLMETCDRLLLQELQGQALPNPSAPLHSESVGLMLDRLSILGLKVYHTRMEIGRPGAPEGHADYNRERLAVLTEQRSDLAAALEALWQDVLAGRKRFKVYRQLKMYNEPSLNPSVYGTAPEPQKG